MVLSLSRFVVLVIAGYLHCPDIDVAMIAPSAASIGALIIRTPLFFAPSRQWHSAKHLELAASLAKDISNFKAVAQYSRQAAMMYQEVGRQAAGAEALTKGGRFCEDGDTGIACELYMEAFELYQDDDTGGGNAGSGGDAYRNCSAMLIREKRWSEAVTVLLKYGQACQRSKSVNSQVRCRPIPYEDGYAYAPPTHFPCCSPLTEFHETDLLCAQRPVSRRLEWETAADRLYRPTSALRFLFCFSLRRAIDP